jgi:hypothetical protein
MRYIQVIKPYVFFAVLTMMLFWLSSSPVSSQTPYEYFVGGANLFINGNTEKARAYVDAGLTEYPDDKKLQALKKAIDEEKKDKNQNQDKEKNQDQNKDQENKDKEQQQNQQDKNQDQQKQQQQPNISKEDAQRLLDALANDEKNVQEKVKEAKAAKAKVRTLVNW